MMLKSFSRQAVPAASARLQTAALVVVVLPNELPPNERVVALHRHRIEVRRGEREPRTAREIAARADLRAA